MIPVIDRQFLYRTFGDDRAVKAFEQLQETVSTNDDALRANVAATGSLSEATFLTLSPNAELPNEYVLKLGPGLTFETGEGEIVIRADGLVQNRTDFEIAFVAAGESEVAVPLSGILATLANVETLENKTLAAPKLTAPTLADLVDAADDAAAAAGGVPVGGVYRDGSVLMVRVA